MSYYNKIKKLDEESLQALKEGTGPSDKCICSLLSPPEDEKSRLASVGASIKKAFTSISGGSRRQKENFNKNVYGGDNVKKLRNMTGQKRVDIPVVFRKKSNGIYTTKETVKRADSCGKCGCDKNNVVMKHSYANIEITSPDVSSICPCPNSCFSIGTNLQDNITVTIEHTEVPPIASIVNQALRRPIIRQESGQPNLNEEIGLSTNKETSHLGVSYSSFITGLTDSTEKETETVPKL